MELNNTILSLRTEKGFTQECLAEMLGVSAAPVSKWGCGNAFPDITLLPKIAEIFGVSVDYLLGYDMTSQKNVSEIVAQANELRRKLKSDEAEELIKQTLARYPNNLQLKFELARHRFVNARYKKKAERDRLLSEAAEGFQYVAEHDESKARRDWSLNFLTTIRMIYKDYDKASEYNNLLLSTKGLYPRVTAAVIQMNQSHDEKALHAIKDGIYGCVFESTMLMPWITHYYMENDDYDAVIKENLRAVKVYEEFTDAGWIYEQLSECYETIALAYAHKKEYDSCLDYLEKSYASAVLYDLQDDKMSYKVYGIPNDIMIEEDIKSSRRSLYNALTSSEREIYAPIREAERYQALLRQLKEEISK